MSCSAVVYDRDRSTATGAASSPKAEFVPVPSGQITRGNLRMRASFDPELSAKRIDVLKDVLPNLRRLAVITNPAAPLACRAAKRVVHRPKRYLKVWAPRDAQ